MGYQLGIDVGTTYTAAAVCRSAGRYWVEPEVVTLGTRAATVPSVLFIGLGRRHRRRRGGRTPRADRSGPGGPRVQAPHRRPHPDRRRRPVLGAGGAVRAAGPLGRRPGRRTRGRPGRADRGHAPGVVGQPQEGPAHGRARGAGAAGHAARRAAGRRVPLRHAGAGRARIHHRGVRPGRRHVRRRRRAQGRPLRGRLRRHGFGLLGRPEGLDRLGGVDFDDVVFDHVREGLPAAFSDLDDTDTGVLSAVARVRRECTEAKEALSADTDVSIPVLLPAGGGSVRLHRTEFESMIRPQVEETVDALRSAVHSAGCRPGELSAVLLVGGSSRIPLVAQLVSEGLARPVAVDADPKNAIAKGAALSVSPMPTASWPEVAIPPVPRAERGADGATTVLIGRPSRRPGRRAATGCTRAARWAPLPPGPVWPPGAGLPEPAGLAPGWPRWRVGPAPPGKPLWPVVRASAGRRRARVWPLWRRRLAGGGRRRHRAGGRWRPGGWRCGRRGGRGSPREGAGDGANGLAGGAGKTAGGAADLAGGAGQGAAGGAGQAAGKGAVGLDGGVQAAGKVRAGLDGGVGQAAARRRLAVGGRRCGEPVRGPPRRPRAEQVGGRPGPSPPARPCTPPRPPRPTPNRGRRIPQPSGRRSVALMVGAGCWPSP